MATMNLPLNTQLEPLLTPLSHFHKSTLSTPLFLSPSPSSTSPRYSPSMSSLPSLVLDLSQHPPQPLTSPPCSDSSGSTPLPLSHPMASVPLTKPTKCLLFRSPLPKGAGIRQVLAWNQEQLVDLRRLWELRRQRRVDQGLIPMTHPPTMISDAALAVGNNENTAMGTLHLSQTHHSTSPLTPLESHCQDLFRPTAWRDLTSVVCRPRRWQLASSTASSKTTKMPLRFHQPTTTGKSSRGSSQKDLASRLTSLPKGWVYATEEVSAAVKAKVTDPSKYLMSDAPLTRSKLKSVCQLDDPHRRHRRASSITEALPSSLSASATSTAVKHRRVISELTLTPQTPL
jgi:hypothetical protein